MPDRVKDRRPTPRATKQRAAVIAALTEVGGFVSAQNLHGFLRTGGEPIGLTTVYRSLQTLADAGEVDVLRASKGEVLYRRCTSVGKHHHHLVCRQCGRTVEVEGPDVEAWATAIARRYKFTDVNHVAELFGTCADCRAA